MTHPCRSPPRAAPSSPAPASSSASPSRRRRSPRAPRRACRPAATRRSAAMNAFVQIGADDTVTVLSQAHRVGPGTVHRPRHARRRGARRRLEPDARRAFARRRQDLREPRLRRAGHRRLDRDRQFLRAAAHRPAPRRAPCWSPPRPRNGACRQARSPSRRAASAMPPRAGKAASARSPTRRRRRRRRPKPKLKDPKDFVLIGTGPAEARHAGEDERHGDLHARHRSPTTC